MMIPESDSIIHKNVISKDGELVGPVTSISTDSIIVTSSYGQDNIQYTYVIPKSRVKGYNSESEVLLKIHYIILDKYRV